MHRVYTNHILYARCACACAGSYEAMQPSTLAATHIDLYASTKMIDENSHTSDCSSMRQIKTFPLVSERTMARASMVRWQGDAQQSL